MKNTIVKNDDFVKDLVEGLKKEGENGRVKVTGVGVFRLKRMKEVIRRNPKTGEQVKVPERLKIKFTPGKALKEALGI